MAPFVTGAFSVCDWFWLWLCDPAGEERKKSGDEVGGTCDCEVCCDDRTLARGVFPSKAFSEASCVSDCSCSSAASASGTMGSLEGGAWELRVPRRGVPLAELRLERRDSGDDILSTSSW